MRDIIRQELLRLAPTLMATQAPPVQNNTMISPVSQPSVSAVLFQTPANAFFPAQPAQPLISLPSQPPPLMLSSVHGYQARPVPAASVPIPGPANQAFTHQASPAPKGSSINDFVSHEEFSVHYSHFDDAIRMVVQASKGVLMAKLDIKSALHLCPVRPEDWELLDITLEWSILC